MFVQKVWRGDQVWPRVAAIEKETSADPKMIVERAPGGDLVIKNMMIDHVLYGEAKQLHRELGEALRYVEVYSSAELFSAQVNGFEVWTLALDEADATRQLLESIEREESTVLAEVYLALWNGLTRWQKDTLLSDISGT